jgi:hypothetical protein
VPSFGSLEPSDLDASQGYRRTIKTLSPDPMACGPLLETTHHPNRVPEGRRRTLREARSLKRRVEDGEPMLLPDRRDRKMHKRLPLPGSIPTGNAYNILLHVEHGPRDEMDRVLQIAREGLAAARQVRRHLLSIRDTAPEDAQLLVDFVCDQIDARSIFGSAFREAAQRLRVDMQQWGTPDEELITIIDQFDRALDAAEVIADMSAAMCALQTFFAPQE